MNSKQFNVTLTEQQYNLVINALLEKYAQDTKGFEPYKSTATSIKLKFLKSQANKEIKTS